LLPTGFTGWNICVRNESRFCDFESVHSALTPDAFLVLSEIGREPKSSQNRPSDPIYEGINFSMVGG
jgi:hypothetical protein